MQSRPGALAFIESTVKLDDNPIRVVHVEAAHPALGVGERQVARPGARNTERGDSIVYTDFTLARLFQVGQDRLEFRADIFNAFNQWNVTADGYVNVVTAANFRQHTGGSNVWPGRQFQFALTYRF